jgi:hypothetical protein
MHYDACDGGAGAQQIPNEAETKRPAAVQVLQINNNSNRPVRGRIVTVNDSRKDAGNKTRKSPNRKEG